MAMNWYRQLVVLLLVGQLVLGPGSIGWSQAQSRDSGGKSKGGEAGRQVPRGPKASGDLAGTPTKGVASLSPAEEQLPGGQALFRAVVPDEYALAPGDNLSINLWGEYNDTYQVKVSPDGRISLPTIGDLEINGLTLARAQAVIEAQVNRYYRNVKTGLSLTALRVFQVRVLGEVLAPGAYLATPVKRVSDIIAQTGGILPGGSQRYVQVRRNGQVYATADLYAFLRKGEESASPYLHDGDVIFVPPMGSRLVTVYISEITSGTGTGGAGALTENSVPYTIELKEGERLNTLVDEVGGANPWWDLEGVLVQRVSHRPEGTMRIPVDLRRYLLENDESQNIVLEPGDQVFIPAQIRKVFVAGAVKLPAPYAFTLGKSADAYLAQAGGAALTADFGESFIKRADGTIHSYNGTAEIDNGDTIVILERTFKTYNDYFAVIGAVAGVLLSGVGMLAAFNNFGR